MSKVRKDNYTSEAASGFTPRTAMEEAARCLLCHDAPCSQGCPAGTDPGKFIRSIRFRNVKGAAETIRENNILGGTCARVCPYDRLCEEACSRCGIDKPIEIGRLQRFAIEQEEAFKMQILNTPENKKNEKVACIGSGPASLACAAKLATSGYLVTIFESEEKAGGVLTYGITPARLPQNVVDQDIQKVKDLGVEFVFNTKVGEDLTIDDIKDKGFEAIFVGTGLWAAKIPDIPGKNLDGVTTAVDFLKNARESKGTLDVGSSVVVIGGGDVAMDCAVSAKLLGAEKVAIYYRRTLEEAPANMEEIQYAISLGVTITTNFAPAEITGDGKVEFITFDGRDKKSSAKVAADTVVFAIGQAPEDMKKLAPIEVTEKGTIEADEDGKTNIDYIFAAGDIVNGGNTVVEAVAQGKKAAEEIMNYFEKKGVK
ncbi:NAD(P)-dependent oxidoreductase [Anaerovorax odorimutans]|uniref:NAD(P)-dependent oxidoreductase n=1 Tax=Anaerovorax odorimutans TaxID=109327 RepID=UPI00041EA8C6|nr:NAD(P)-dependent oxidoreductase [Anaerovorax odorimutans]